MIQAVLLSGLFIGLLSALPVVNIANCCCVWVIGGGILAAYLQQQNEGGRSLPVARGATVGLLAGVAGAFVWLIASIPLSVVLGPLQQRMVQEMLQGATDMPPNVRELLEGVGDRASSPFQYVFGFLFHLCAGLIFATAGGAIGASFFKRDVPPALGGDPVVPPVPPQP
jgi:hypothetical protein